jgi:hypothetical protein
MKPRQDLMEDAIALQMGTKSVYHRYLVFTLFWKMYQISVKEILYAFLAGNYILCGLDE